MLHLQFNKGQTTTMFFYIKRRKIEQDVHLLMNVLMWLCAQIMKCKNQILTSLTVVYRLFNGEYSAGLS